MKFFNRTPDARDNTTQTQTKGTHLVCSSGGSRAILAAAGAIAAVDQAGIRDFDSIGGVSGGSVPTAFYAAGISAAETVRMTIEIDFSSKLTRHGSIIQILFAYFMQGRFEKTRPRHGVLSSEKLGTYIEERVQGWPTWIGKDGQKHSYWTMAVVGKNQVLFDHTGVREIAPDGTITVLSDKPAPLGLAVRASCAIPGIISAVPFKGRFLFDGALSRDGGCPVVIPERYYGATEAQTIACDVGDDGNGSSKKLLKLWKLICGGNCLPQWEDKELTEKNGMVVVKPALTGFRSLQFTLTKDQKWMAVMDAYMATVEGLKRGGRMTGKALQDAEAIVVAHKEARVVCKDAEPGVLALLTENLMAKYGLY
ncbi:MAG TPA: patatin-like phospholipase family protein [Planktothrix sp.]